MRFCHLINRSFVCKTKDRRYIRERPFNLKGGGGYVFFEIVIYINNLWIFTYFSIEILGLFRWNVAICMNTCLKTIPFYNHIEVSETFQTNAKIKSSTERGLQYFFYITLILSTRTSCSTPPHVLPVSS